MSEQVRQVDGKCSVERCENPHLSRSWCSTQYRRWNIYGDPLFTKSVKGVGSTPEERFWTRVAITSDSSRCWAWSGTKDKHGYGHVNYGGEYWLAHRLSWFLAKGARPKMALLHSCPGGDNPNCVNPEHLREGTALDNTRDMMNRDGHYTQRRTHCRNGHDLRVEGAIKVTSRENLCRECDLNRKQRWNRKQGTK